METSKPQTAPDTDAAVLFDRLREAIAVPPSQDDAISAALTAVSAWINEVSRQRADLEEQLEAVTQNRDGLQETINFLWQYPEVRKLWPSVSIPASDPLGLDQADRDFAAGKARPASEVFADLGLESNQDTKP